MVKKIVLSVVFLVALSYESRANFDFNTNCIKAYQAIFDLRLSDAKALLAKERQLNPKNGIPILLDNYVDYFTLLTSENKADYNRLKSLKSERINALGKQDKNSPYYLFSQAEVNLQWGLLKSRFHDYLSAGMDLKRASNLLDENAAKFPSFIPNKKSAGLIDVIFGSVPSDLKGLFSTLGISGNSNTGIRTLELLSRSLSQSPYSFYRDEVTFFLCYIETDLVHNKANYDKLIALLSSMRNTSLLKNYLQGYISLRNAHNDTAIKYFLTRPEGDGHIDFPALNYYLGTAKLNRIDNDAHIYLATYLKKYNGINFIKDAYLKLAYHYYLQGNITRYNTFRALAKTEGNLYEEKDKQALKEANDGSPDIDLLKARLYFDGGYYSKALSQLSNIDREKIILKRNLIELHYRLGRIYDETGKDSNALLHYQKTINEGKSTSYYFAANAALNIGMIYEARNDRTKASIYYKQAISMKDHEYENSIETKAKDGLKRLGR